MTNYAQDMPPKGGFGEFNYKAVPAKRWISNKKLASGLILCLGYGHYQNRKLKLVYAHDQVLETDARNAMEPFLEAERDRNFLIQLRKNREMEMKIMKDVPGWVPGTVYGVPIFKSLEKDELIPESTGTFNLFSNDENSRQANPDRLGLSEWRM